MSDGAKRTKITWDEEVIAEHDKLRGTRMKIDEPFGCQSIETVRGAGYRLRADGGRS